MRGDVQDAAAEKSPNDEKSQIQSDDPPSNVLQTSEAEAEVYLGKRKERDSDEARLKQEELKGDNPDASMSSII